MLVADPLVACFRTVPAVFRQQMDTVFISAVSPDHLAGWRSADGTGVSLTHTGNVYCLNQSASWNRRFTRYRRVTTFPARHGSECVFRLMADQCSPCVTEPILHGLGLGSAAGLGFASMYAMNRLLSTEGIKVENDALEYTNEGQNIMYIVDRTSRRLHTLFVAPPSLYN